MLPPQAFFLYREETVVPQKDSGFKFAWSTTASFAMVSSKKRKAS